MNTISQEGLPRKRCSKCLNFYPATTQFFGRDTSKKDGLYPSCKVCKKSQGKIWRDAHPDYLKQYYQQHREGRKEQNHHYQIVHKEEIREQRKQSRQLYREKINARNKVYYDAHREEYNTRHRQYFKTERGRVVRQVNHQKRKAQKKAIEGTLISTEIQQKLKAQQYRCYYAACGFTKFQKVKGKYIYYIEHTIPISRTEAGPRHDVNFVVLACPSCNMKKHDKVPHEFFEGGRLF